MTDDATLPAEVVQGTPSPEAPASEPVAEAASEVSQAEPEPSVDAQERASESPASATPVPPQPSAPEPRASPVNTAPLHHHWSAEDRVKSAKKRNDEKEAVLAKIIERIRVRGKIRNDEIVHDLRIPDRTAARYTKILVERSALKREGRGRGAVYVLQ